ncbi:J domain-containing protein [Kribbella sp. HUAS MG21]|uniref:J domain-containing protein n=1 Tax=Kribbella sp. HUAS MG21 TaxID=3160966 RepID=A0AAU7TJ48_9ACTN
MRGSDHYEVLNVDRSASPAEIKSAYRKLVRQVHPDQGGNAALFRLVQEAWTTLSDPAKRAAYDRQLDNAGTPTAQPRTTTREEPDPAPADPFTWSTEQPWANTSQQQQHDQPPPQPQDDQPQEPLHRTDSGPVHAVPTFGRWRLPALLALALWTALLVGVYLSDGIQDAWDIALGVGIAGMLVLALPPHWSRRVPLSALLKVLGAVTAALYLAMLLFANDELSTLDRALVVALVVGLVVVRVLTGRWSKAHALDRAVDRTATYEFNLWGRPGEPLVETTLAAPITQYDVMLQRRTANLLDPVVAALPAAKLVHGAQLGAMVVDHLLLNGHRAALVLSLAGPPGAYSLDAYGGLQHNGQPLDSPAQALEGAVQSWRARLRQVDVRGFLIIRSDTGKVTTHYRSDAPVTPLAPQTAARDLLTWLQPEGNVVDRQVLYDILHRAPYGLT